LGEKPKPSQDEQQASKQGGKVDRRDFASNSQVETVELRESEARTQHSIPQSCALAYSSAALDSFKSLNSVLGRSYCQVLLTFNCNRLLKGKPDLVEDKVVEFHGTWVCSWQP
jgi:hypothetical protein